MLFKEHGQHTDARTQDKHINLFIQFRIFKLSAQLLGHETEPGETGLVALVSQ